MVIERDFPNNYTNYSTDAHSKELCNLVTTKVIGNILALQKNASVF